MGPATGFYRKALHKMSTTPNVPATATRAFSNDQLASIHSVADLMAAAIASGMEVENVKDYGTGFELGNKDHLLGVGFAIAEFRFSDGKQGKFASMAVVTEDGRKLIINDGSTGIRDQLLAIAEKRDAEGRNPRAPLWCPKGLRKSDYEVPDDKTGEMIPSTTYYLSF